MVIQADLPGVAREDLQIHGAPGALTIHAQVPGEHSRGGAEAARSHRWTVVLPADVDFSAANAVLQNGLLIITLPVRRECASIPVSE